MKRILLTLAAACLLVLSGAARADEIGVSIQLQQDQIANDAKAGLLRPSEVKALAENIDRIKFEYKRAKSRGVLNHYDVLTLNQMLAENANTLLLWRAKK